MSKTVDDLYGLPLDQFVPERSALAKALKADGERATAAEVASLRKPTVAAWAVNQLVRTQRKDVKALLAAGDALRKAQDALLAGRGDARKLRDASERERAAREALLEKARGLLTSEGEELSATVLERVGETLHAAALDEAAREQVRDGRLTRELRHAGLGFGDGTVLAASPPAARPRPPRKREEPEPTKRERAAAEREAAAEAERAAALKAARSEELAARRRIEKAARTLKAAEERRARAADALAAAEEQLAAARDEAVIAENDHSSAEAVLDRLTTET